MSTVPSRLTQRLLAGVAVAALSTAASASAAAPPARIAVLNSARQTKGLHTAQLSVSERITTDDGTFWLRANGVASLSSGVSRFDLVFVPPYGPSQRGRLISVIEHHRSVVYVALPQVQRTLPHRKEWLRIESVVPARQLGIDFGAFGGNRGIIKNAVAAVSDVTRAQTVSLAA